MGRLGALHVHGVQVPLSVFGFAFASVLALPYLFCTLHNDAQNLLISNDARHLSPMSSGGFNARIRLGLCFFCGVTGPHVPLNLYTLEDCIVARLALANVCQTKLGTLEVPKQFGGRTKEDACRRVVLQC